MRERRRPRGARRVRRTRPGPFRADRDRRGGAGARPSSPRSAPALPRRPRPETIAPALKPQSSRPTSRSASLMLCGWSRASPAAIVSTSPADQRRAPGALGSPAAGRLLAGRYRGLRRHGAVLPVDVGRRASDGADAPRLAGAMSVRAQGPAARCELAARRAAFLAAERARQVRARRTGSSGADSEPVFVREKSPGTAYLLWFFLGGSRRTVSISAIPVSGAIQAALLPISWMLIFSRLDRGLPDPGCSAGSGSSPTPS